MNEISNFQKNQSTSTQEDSESGPTNYRFKISSNKITVYNILLALKNKAICVPVGKKTISYSIKVCFLSSSSKNNCLKDLKESLSLLYVAYLEHDTS